MDPRAIYHKSTKGLEEIAERKYKLLPRLRSVLILVDGKRTFEDLAKLSAAMGDPFELLSQLLTDGFIETEALPESHVTTMPAAMAATPATAAPAPVVAAPEPPRSLQDARRYAVRHLTDLMGPNAEMLCIKIESAKGLTDFITAVVRAQDVLRNLRGAPAAEKFAQEMAARTPLE
ncbi:MAG: hypothetical protein ACKVIH_11710 [Burkholderiales bacterium]